MIKIQSFGSWFKNIVTFVLENRRQNAQKVFLSRADEHQTWLRSWFQEAHSDSTVHVWWWWWWWWLHVLMFIVDEAGLCQLFSSLIWSCLKLTAFFCFYPASLARRRRRILSSSSVWHGIIFQPWWCHVLIINLWSRLTASLRRFSVFIWAAGQRDGRGVEFLSYCVCFIKSSVLKCSVCVMLALPSQQTNAFFFFFFFF